MHTHISHSHAHLSVLAKRIELRKLFTTYGIVSVALSFVSAFGPIYLLRSGYEIRDILYYFLLTAVIKVVVLPFVFKLMHRIGSNKVMALGIFFLIINFALFATLEWNTWPLWLLACAKAIGNGCYYAAYRVNFAVAHTKEKTGRQAAFAHSMVLTLGILAPLAGGALSYFWSVSAVYVAAIVLFLVAAIIIWGAPQEYIRKMRLRDVPRGSATKDYASNFSYSFSTIADLLAWPLLISLIIPSYVGIGAIGTLFAVLSIVVTIFVGKRIDTKTIRFGYLGYGVGFSALYNIGRLFASTTSHLIGLGFLGAIGGSLTSVSYDQRYFSNASHKGWLEYLFVQEVANSVPWLIYFPLLIAGTYFFELQTVLYLGVLLSIPFIFGTLLIRNQSIKSTT